MRVYRRLVAGLLVSCAVVPAGSALAQDAPPSSTPPTAAPPGDASGEIVVTAQRRSESLQRVPIAINQFSGQTLEKLTITQSADLQRVTPGFNFQTESGSAQLSIRGVGTGYSGQGLEQSVGLYIDGAYISSQLGAATPLLDIKQVQVLKGPQGALYGRNATGGAVLIDTNDPDPSGVSGYAQVGYGNYDWLRTEAVVNLPASEKIAFRLAGEYQDRDSFVYNERLDQHDYGQKEFLVRGKVLLQPSDDFKIVGALDYYHERYEAPHINVASGSLCSYCASLGIGLPSGFYHTYANVGSELNAILGDRRNLAGDTNGEIFSRVLNGNVRMEYDLGDIKLKSVTDYRKVRVDGPDNDQDAGPLPLIYTLSKVKNRSINEDFQLSSNFSGSFNFVGGVNYQHDSNKYQLGLAGSEFGPLILDTDSRDRTNSISVFIEGYLKFLRDFTLTVGGRYTHDQRFHEFFNNADAALVFGIGTDRQRANFNSFTPRFVLSYDAGNANYYVSYNKGVKAGGFNSPSFVTADPVDPEKIDAYEVGAKFQLLNRQLRLNMAAFHYDWKDLQVAVIDSANGGLAQQNAASAVANGGELMIDWTPVRDLTLSLNGLYVDSHYKSFANASVFVPASTITPGANGQVAASEDLRGFQTPNAPKFSGTAIVDYRFGLGSSDWHAEAVGSASYKSKYDMQPGAGGIARLIRQKSYGTVNARLSVINPGGDLTISAWADNLTGTHYYLNLVATVDGGYGIPAAPRTYGVMVARKF